MSTLQLARKADCNRVDPERPGASRTIRETGAAVEAILVVDEDAPFVSERTLSMGCVRVNRGCHAASEPSFFFCCASLG